MTEQANCQVTTAQTTAKATTEAKQNIDMKYWSWYSKQSEQIDQGNRRSCSPILLKNQAKDEDKLSKDLSKIWEKRQAEQKRIQEQGAKNFLRDASQLGSQLTGLRDSALGVGKALSYAGLIGEKDLLKLTDRLLEIEAIYGGIQHETELFRGALFSGANSAQYAGRHGPAGIGAAGSYRSFTNAGNRTRQFCVATCRRRRPCSERSFNAGWRRSGGGTICDNRRQVPQELAPSVAISTNSHRASRHSRVRHGGGAKLQASPGRMIRALPLSDQAVGRRGTIGYLVWAPAMRGDAMEASLQEQTTEISGRAGTAVKNTRGDFASKISAPCKSSTERPRTYTDRPSLVVNRMWPIAVSG